MSLKPPIPHHQAILTILLDGFDFSNLERKDGVTQLYDCGNALG